MKRLLLSLLSLSLGLPAFAMMRKEEPTVQISMDEVLNILNFHDTENALNLLQGTASRLCAQDELAQAIKICQSYRKITEAVPGIAEASISMQTTAKEHQTKSYKDLTAAHYLKHFTSATTTPEGIAFALNTAEILNKINEEPIDWENFIAASKSEQQEIRAIALDMLESKDLLEPFIKQNNAILKQHSLSAILEKPVYSLGYEYLEFLKAYTDYLASKEKIENQITKYIDMLKSKNTHVSPEEIEKFLTTHPNAATLDLATFITGKMLPEFLSFQAYMMAKLRTLDDQFVENYSQMRSICCKVYKAVRSALNKICQNNSETINTKQYLSKLYDANCLLPRELPASIEPLIEQAPKLTEPVLNIPEQSKVLSQEKPAPKNKNEKSKKTKKQQKASTITPTVISNPTLITEPAAVKASSALANKKHVPSLIKEIKDPLNNMSIHLYCSFKQKKEVPVFARHNRLYVWFENGKKALQQQGYLDPSNPKHIFIDTAIAFHSFSLDVDPIAQKYGTQYEQINKNGERTLFIALPGHIEKNGQRIFGIFGYAIDPHTKICYHRCFEPKTSQELLKEYLDENIWKVALEDLES